AAEAKIRLPPGRHPCRRSGRGSCASRAEDRHHPTLTRKTTAAAGLRRCDAERSREDDRGGLQRARERWRDRLDALNVEADRERCEDFRLHDPESAWIT